MQIQDPDPHYNVCRSSLLVAVVTCIERLGCPQPRLQLPPLFKQNNKKQIWKESPLISYINKRKKRFHSHRVNIEYVCEVSIPAGVKKNQGASRETEYLQRDNIPSWGEGTQCRLKVGSRDHRWGGASADDIPYILGSLRHLTRRVLRRPGFLVGVQYCQVSCELLARVGDDRSGESAVGPILLPLPRCSLKEREELK